MQAAKRRRRPVAQAEAATPAAQPALESIPPPHLQRGALPRPDDERPDYVLVVPSYNRPAAMKEKTMKLLLEQKVPLDRVFVFVADTVAEGSVHDEHSRYIKALCPLGVPECNIVIGVRGIMQQRSFIVRWVLNKFGPLKHVVSLDDDIEGLSYKVRTGFDDAGRELGVLKTMEVGGLEAWIAHANEAMLKTKSFIWSVNTSNNHMFMQSAVISTCNGMCNGYFYGFRARPDEDLLCILETATEDRERSTRYFAKDGIVLRYKMYTSKTKCFKNEGGIQDDYKGSIAIRNDARKVDERAGHQKIENAFGDLYSAAATVQKKSVKTMEGSFVAVRARNPMFAHGLFSDLRPKKRGEGTLNGGSRAHLRGKLRSATKVGKFQRSFAQSRRQKTKAGNFQRGIAIPFRDSDGIKYRKNTKKAGTMSHERYEKYMAAQTIAEARQLGVQTADLRHDPDGGFLQILALDTTPASNECKVKDNAALSEGIPGVSRSKSASVVVRTKEMVGSRCCLQVSRDLLVQLCRRSGPALLRCAPGKWEMSNGPLAEVPLDVVRILLEWAKTGVLSYSLQSAPAVYQGLMACGATSLAERARCREVATGQASLARFFGGVRAAGTLDAEQPEKASASKARAKSHIQDDGAARKGEEVKNNLSMCFRPKDSADTSVAKVHLTPSPEACSNTAAPSPAAAKRSLDVSTEAVDELASSASKRPKRAKRASKVQEKKPTASPEKSSEACPEKAAQVAEASASTRPATEVANQSGGSEAKAAVSLSDDQRHRIAQNRAAALLRRQQAQQQQASHGSTETVLQVPVPCASEPAKQMNAVEVESQKPETAARDSTEEACSNEAAPAPKATDKPASLVDNTTGHASESCVAKREKRKLK